ncbi:unnamed protein product [Lathyrus sativus]|nr:unnamed protein product [Lathyrus sativus]
MEYMSSFLYKMKRNPNFNHYSKCEKMEFTHLTFDDDIVLFYRGDKGSVELMTHTMQQFSNSTGLVVNPSKCNVYLGAVDEAEMHQILRMTGYNEGKLPFKVQLVNVVGFAISNYWLQCFPIPKVVIEKIHTACRTFIWAGGTSPSRKPQLPGKQFIAQKLRVV